MKKKPTKYVRLDWAIKRLLRHKTDFVILNGFLSSLLGEEIKIQKNLESEGNKTRDTAKINRVDILAEDSKGRKIIIEIQNTLQNDYFHRMLFGTSKIITEYITEGEDYGTIKKVYSVNIVYFQLGQGHDYVYHGKTEFKGLHTKDILNLSDAQQKQFPNQKVSGIFPEYFILRVEHFNQKAKDSLDQWIYFLKTDEIPPEFTAPGLPEAREKLRVARLSPAEKTNYEKHLELLRFEQSANSSVLLEGMLKGREQGKIEREIEIARTMLARSFPVETIAEITGLPPEKIRELKN
jgi:predicted transposase/invertase (TIGR01784 family)